MFIIGNLKIDETRPERIQYLLATILSYTVIRKYGMGITLHYASDSLFEKVFEVLDNNNIMSDFSLITTMKDENGVEVINRVAERQKSIGGGLSENRQLNTYWDGIRIHTPPQDGYYVTLEEDHFWVPEDYDIFNKSLKMFTEKDPHIIRASFNEIEKNSCIAINGQYIDGYKTFLMTKENHEKFNQFYGQRYFIGTNNIIKTSFAEKLYSRPGNRPHDFEIYRYDPNFEYTCAIPEQKLMQCIDDDHGAVESCLLKSPTEKFLNCMKQAKNICNHGKKY